MNSQQIFNRTLKLELLLIPEALRDVTLNPNEDNQRRYSTLCAELELYQDIQKHPNLLERNTQHIFEPTLNLQRIRDYQRGAI